MAGISIKGLSKTFSSRESDVAAVADVDVADRILPRLEAVEEPLVMPDPLER